MTARRWRCCFGVNVPRQVPKTFARTSRGNAWRNKVWYSCGVLWVGWYKGNGRCGKQSARVVLGRGGMK